MNRGVLARLVSPCWLVSPRGVPPASRGVATDPPESWSRGVAGVFVMTFRVQGSGFRVWGIWFSGKGLKFRVQGSGCRVQGPGLRVGDYQV